MSLCPCVGLSNPSAITSVKVRKSSRVKSGNFGQRVNSDIRLKTVTIQMRQSFHQDFHCLLSYFFFYSNNPKIKETRSLSEFSRLSQFTQLNPYLTNM